MIISSFWLCMHFSLFRFADCSMRYIETKAACRS
nr:MAG TPA: hypothetical protein [Caudoviricetes sp.]DAT33903.1 MAG TPA: hypothetical protein [Caudoviricetes sp.]DAU61112.1 MAG TPA: hypothetical protein [Caudoviricetes sp.]